MQSSHLTRVVCFEPADNLQPLVFGRLAVQHRAIQPFGKGPQSKHPVAKNDDFVAESFVFPNKVPARGEGGDGLDQKM